ncbi:signal peptidase I [Oscillochloris sp. ZM17-4]|uniref:signal peptidase I n=1 Tax=Oscillochloris sp. ZM17-4 TaxID=2866714 RepID=UPI001C734DB6|nr:signal peptidase I [Oscillochloris sp. ZM17-4]MBX0330465.1 signal peptidase I [Oscillochloris sp. ZM17-4]
MPRLTHRRSLSANALYPLPVRRPTHLLTHLLKAVIYALIILSISSTLIARYRIEQTSMEPNFYPGQRVLVSQAGRTLGGWISGSAYAADPGATAAAGLQRGQIVVFYETDDQRVPPLIKRLIGLPGDQVAIRDGGVFINDSRLPEPYLVGTTECSLYCNVTLGANEYFFMGDNRPVSQDSRQFGPVLGDHVVGRVVLRFWPIDQLSLFL